MNPQLPPLPVGRPRRGRRGASASHPNRVLIIGLGNEYRHDDAIGLVVARTLQRRTRAGITVLEQSGEGAALLEAWKGYSVVFLVDAVSSGAPPGTIHRLDAHAAPLPRRLFQYSTHAFSLPEAIELARALHQLPPHLQFYGIEGKDFSAGLGLSPEVDQAAAAVAEEILGSLFNPTPQTRKAASRWG